MLPRFSEAKAAKPDLAEAVKFQRPINKMRNVRGGHERTAHKPQLYHTGTSKTNIPPKLKLSTPCNSKKIYTNAATCTAQCRSTTTAASSRYSPDHLSQPSCASSREDIRQPVPEPEDQQILLTSLPESANSQTYSPSISRCTDLLFGRLKPPGNTEGRVRELLAENAGCRVPTWLWRMRFKILQQISRTRIGNTVVAGTHQRGGRTTTQLDDIIRFTSI